MTLLIYIKSVSIKVNLPFTITVMDEATIQTKIRTECAKEGIAVWRNNVGANRIKEEHFCPACRFKFYISRPALRWGLCNDSDKINARFKSSDLIGIKPVVITQDMVGKTIGQFVSIEVKPQKWSYRGTKHEKAQLNWIRLIQQHGGVACFSNGSIKEIL